MSKSIKPALNEVVQALKALKGEYPNMINRIGIPSSKNVESFFSKFTINIPIEYKQFLCIINGFTIRYDSIYGIPPGAEITGIEERLNSVPEYRLGGYIPIGDDGAGNDYVLDTSSNEAPVLFFDASRGWESPTSILSSSLSMFLMMLILESRYREENNKIRWPSDKSFVLKCDPLIQNFKYQLPWNV
jgi:hypothetical protein